MTVKSATRRQELHSFKRQRILEAAATQFQTKGLGATTMRAIASEAGYSIGAPYAYYQSKEEIFADLVNKSLSDVTRAVKLASQTTLPPRALIRAVFIAFYKYYAANPTELQLCLSLYSGLETRKTTLPDEVESQFNSRLMALLGFMANCLHSNTHLQATDAQAETMGCFTFMVGALALQSTGRLEILGADGQEVVDRYMDRMLTSAGT